MGMLVDGQWQTGTAGGAGEDGHFHREESTFRRWLSADGGCAPNGQPVLIAEPTNTWRPCDRVGSQFWKEVVKEPKLVAILGELDALTLDTGTKWFQPSNLEITDINVGNRAHNVIPAAGAARISIRFNDLHTGQELADRVTAIAERHGGSARAVISGEAFLTPPGAFREAWKIRKKVPGFYTRNALNVPDTAQRLHWEKDWANELHPKGSGFKIIATKCWKPVLKVAHLA